MDHPNKLVVAIHQPNYIPWLGFFSKMKNAGIFIYLDDVQFPKQSFASRNYIKAKDGSKVLLSVPVKMSKGAFQNYNEIEIDYSQKWQVKHLNMIRDAYGKAPFFKTYFDPLGEIIKNTYPSLADMNIALIDLVSEWLQIKTPRIRSSSIQLMVDEKTDRNILLTKHMKGTHYLSGKGAAAYNDPVKFEQAGMHLVYSGYEETAYPQLHGDFVSHLSALDCLFNCGAEACALHL